MVAETKKHQDDSKAKTAADKPDGPKEHVEAIRYHLNELQATNDEATKAIAQKISDRVDALEGKKDKASA